MVAESSNALPEGSRNTEAICLVYRQTGTDAKYFACGFPGCDRHYSRWPDFLRHYDGLHAVNKKEFWCPVPGCERRKSFPRKDKMMDHARKVQGVSVNECQA